MTSRFFAVTLTLLTSLSSAGLCRAQENHNFDKPYTGVKASLGFGSLSTSTEVGNVTVTPDDCCSLSPSFGLAGQYVYPIIPFFAVGGMLGVTSWRSSAEGDGGRNLNLDLAVVPIGKYAVLDDLELFVSLPIGLTLNFLNEDASNSQLFIPLLRTGGGTNVDAGAALGFMLEITAGARYALSESFGLTGELGYSLHTVSHTVEVATVITSPAGSFTSSTFERDTSVSWSQFIIRLGAYF